MSGNYTEKKKELEVTLSSSDGIRDEQCIVMVVWGMLLCTWEGWVEWMYSTCIFNF